MSERFLANENIPSDFVGWLRECGHDVAHAAESNVGESDEVLLRIASDEDRIVLTFDTDFGELVFHQQERPARGIVLFRIRQQPRGAVLASMAAFFESEPTLEGYFTVVEPGHFRQTQLHPRK